MYYMVESNKSFALAVEELASAVLKNGFDILNVHDLGSTLRNTGAEFKSDCKVFDIGDPVKAAQILTSDARANMVLPCRISVFTQDSKTIIGLLRPVPILTSLSNDEALVRTAAEIEEKTIKMVNSIK